jgi:ABC-type glycerol-3-phosphate transport system substrate-binding protein
MKKVLVVIMVAVLLILTVTGCSSKDNKDKEVDKALEGGLSKGRYVEEDIVLPLRVDVSEFVSITVAPNGDVELYAYNDSVYEKYLYIDKSWSKVDAEAFQSFSNISANSFMITDVFYGEDERQYLLGDTLSEYRNALYRLSDTGEFEKVELKRFDDSYEEWRNMAYRPEVLKVLENGMIVAAYPWRVIEVYSPDGQSMIGEYNCGRSCVLAAEGNILYYTDQNDKEIFSTNMETKKEGISRSVEIDTVDTGILEIDKEKAYVCNTSGIHLNKEGGSLWETLIDGSQSSLSMPSKILTNFILGTEDEYYIVFSNMENTDVSLKHIFYDANLSSVPPIELSIFSIEDNASIRQAITVFQESHPDVRINFRVANLDQRVKYTYGIKNPEETITLKDHINALNTELLAGRGADILVLDGMPIESYIDKGVLEDMGSIFTPMKASGELLPNIIDPYYSDDKVYAMPLRFKLPIIYGSSDAVNAANSTKELAEYARNNKEIPLLRPSNYRALAAWFLMMNYDQILNQDNEIDEVSLKDFIETIKIISDAIHASDDVELDYMNSNKVRTMGYWICASINVYKKEIQANIEELGGMLDFAVPIAVVQEWQGSFRAINNSFKAKGLVGINSAGNQKELAKEFIQLLFSKEIQRLDLLDGFPVNKAAMEEWIHLDKDNYGFTVGDEEYTIDALYPKQKPRKNIYESICAVDKPMVNDMTMVDMILDEAERYLRGDITAEQAAKNAVASINLYLSE